MCDWRGYWAWPATEDADKQWDPPHNHKEWRSVRILTEEIRPGVVFNIGEWLKRALWTNWFSMDEEGYESICNIPQPNQLFPHQLELWHRYKTSSRDIRDSLTLFSVKTTPKKNRDDDPLANEYRAVPMPTPTCGNVIEWLAEILKERGKGFGFGVGLVPLEAFEEDVDSMDVDHMAAESASPIYRSAMAISESGGNSPGGDVAASPPREEPPTLSLPPRSPVKPANRMREASAAGSHWKKTKWEICKALLTPLDKFLITDDELSSTETCLEIKSEGEILEGTYKQSIVLHLAELSRERVEILRSSPKDLNRRVRGQNFLGALWHEFQDLIAEAKTDGINWFGDKEDWSMDVIGEIVRKVYLFCFR